MATAKEISEQNEMVKNVATFLTEELCGVETEVEPLLLLDALACHGYVLAKATVENVASQAFIEGLS